MDLKAFIASWVCSVHMHKSVQVAEDIWDNTVTLMHLPVRKLFLDTMFFHAAIHIPVLNAAQPSDSVRFFPH